MPRYWVTTHWPPREGQDATPLLGVWVPDGREVAAVGLAPGDRVLVYEARSGRTEIRVRADGTQGRVRCKLGREGLVLVGEGLEHLSAEPETKPSRYTDGTDIWWRGYAPLKDLGRSGFVPRARVASLLGYKPSYNFRGFGKLRSGIQELSRDQYERLLGAFRASRPVELPAFRPRPGRGGGTGVESVEHRLLKDYVARDPETALGEQGLRTVKVEYQFPTGDKADLVLVDKLGRVVGAEVETYLPDSDEVGALQAIKYRRILEWLTGREAGDSRSFLVAHDSVVGDGSRRRGRCQLRQFPQEPVPLGSCRAAPRGRRVDRLGAGAQGRRPGPPPAGPAPPPQRGGP